MTPGEAKAAYRRLFQAHLLAILATGIVTVALALIAYDIAGDEAGAALGTALALKMAVNILATPVLGGFMATLPSRARLLRPMAARAVLLLFVPLVDALWQIYVIVVLFQAAAAAFMVTYLATVPELLPDEEDYARAVAKSKIAYDVEGLVSPLVVAAVLAVVDVRQVFLLAALLLAASAMLLLRARFPAPSGAGPGRFGSHLGHVRRLSTAPDLRGGLALSVAALVVAAMITVNTVVLVKGAFDLDDRAAVIALAAYGAGGVAAALVLHRLIAGDAARSLMLGSGALMAGLLMAGAFVETYAGLLGLWAALGVATTFAQLPFAALIRRHGARDERQGLYAAHYSVSHATQLVAYLSAGWIAVEGGMAPAFIGFGLFSAAMVLLARLSWRTAPQPAADISHR